MENSRIDTREAGNMMLRYTAAFPPPSPPPGQRNSQKVSRQEAKNVKICTQLGVSSTSLTENRKWKLPSLTLRNRDRADSPLSHEIGGTERLWSSKDRENNDNYFSRNICSIQRERPDINLGELFHSLTLSNSSVHCLSESNYS